MQTVITTNNAYDSILLIDDQERVVSCWTATTAAVRQYVQTGANAGEWEVGSWPDAGLEDARTIAAYGTEYGRNGRIEIEERAEFWGVDQDSLAKAATR